jgi:hypothetical protein
MEELSSISDRGSAVLIEDAMVLLCHYESAVMPQLFPPVSLIILI